MVDITKIELNPIPLPIIELQMIKTVLEGKNKTLRNLLIVLGVIGALYVVNKIIKYNQEENARKNEEEFPNII